PPISRGSWFSESHECVRQLGFERQRRRARASRPNHATHSDISAMAGRALQEVYPGAPSTRSLPIGDTRQNSEVLGCARTCVLCEMAKTQHILLKVYYQENPAFPSSSFPSRRRRRAMLECRLGVQADP